MGSCEGSGGIRKGSIGIRMKGTGSITFSNGSGRPDGVAQHGIQCGIRGGSAGNRMKGMGSIAFSNGSGRPCGSSQDGIL